MYNDETNKLMNQREYIQSIIPTCSDNGRRVVRQINGQAVYQASCYECLSVIFNGLEHDQWSVKVFMQDPKAKDAAPKFVTAQFLNHAAAEISQMKYYSKYTYWISSPAYAYKENVERVDKDGNRYILANNVKLFGQEFVASYQSIVIDLDDHKGIVGKERFFELVDYIINDTGIEPNVVHWTGRGIQLWYCVDQHYVTGAKNFFLAEEMLISAIKLVMDSYEQFDDIERDFQTTRRNQFYRLFGTYNPKAPEKDARTEAFILRTERYTCEYLLGWLDIAEVTESLDDYNKNALREVVELDKDLDLSRIKTNSIWKPLMIKRARFILAINKRRLKSGQSIDRKRTLFLLYNCYVQLYDRRTAKRMIENYNDTFENPLTDIEILKHVYSAVDDKKSKRHADVSLDKAGSVWFRKNLWFDVLGCTDEEKRLWWSISGGSGTKKNDVRDAKRARAKADRIKNLQEAVKLIEKGKTIKEASECMNVAERTLRDYMNKNHIKALQSAREVRDSKILRLTALGKTALEISAELGCSKRTVQNVRKKAPVN
jgi:DNA-binding CsgD family transcriptional regulator